MGIQAVFFDMGGTLERVWYTSEQRLQAVPGLQWALSSAGINLGLNNEELYDVILSGHDRYHKWSIQTMAELSPAWVWSRFILSGYPVDQEKLSAAAEGLMLYLENSFYQRELRPEVPAVLESIQKLGLKIGLISNICSQGLVPENLKQYGIYPYFDPIVLSSQYKRRKPDPAIFHYAARLANAPTSRCVYVGDRIARDIVGARRAGFRLAVQILNDFDHGEEDSGAEPDAVIRDMRELLGILNDELGISGHAGKRQNHIRAFFFDAGDVLYYRPNRSQNLRSFLLQQGIAGKDIPLKTINALKRRAYHGLITQDEYREAILHLYGLNDPALIELGKHLMDRDDNNVEFFKGVPDTLKKLKEKGYMLGIITDTSIPTHVKLSWFEQGGFGDVWDSIISSKELGCQKPDPRIYRAALDQIGLSPDRSIFVGHDPHELQGAKSVGMKTIAFNYEEGVTADFYIKNFPDLLTLSIISSGNAQAGRQV
jgi:putative hydrolase of the HAD superfamily